MQDKTINEIENELIKIIEKSGMVVHGLENNQAYIQLISDFKDTANKIDDAWHLVSDLNKLNEMRITKLAAVSIVNALDNYKMDLNKATEQLAKLRNPDKIMDKDYDEQ